LTGGEHLPAVLLPYQQEAVAATDQVLVWEKSRRIGASWGVACLAAMTAAADPSAGGDDVLYIGYNREMAEEFMADSAFWAKHLAAFAGQVPEVEEYVFEDETDDGKRSIQAFRIRFASGFKIAALASRPRSLRGRQGVVILDEAAFHENLAELIKAALALLMWGGRVLIISTHDGADNPFNELVEDCRAGRRPYRVMRTTFQEAVAQGLYRRICLAKGQDWSAAGEAEWVARMYAFYGDAAGEELDVVPSQGSGVWLTRALIDACANPASRVVHWHGKDGFELEPDHVRRAAAEAWLLAEVEPLLAALDRDAMSFLGGDFARTGDLTVLMPGQLGRGSVVLRVPFVVELRNIPFEEQRFILFWLIDRLPRFAGGALDARGLGAMLAELAMQRFGASRIQEVKATREWYRETMPALKARFEDRTIEIPRDADITQDLRAVRVDKGVPMLPEGVRIRSSRGGTRHGDAAIAAVMLEAATQGRAAPIGFEASGRTVAGGRGFELPEPGGFLAGLQERGRRAVAGIGRAMGGY
jgi:phage FluMu gp28-like protein